MLDSTILNLMPYNDTWDMDKAFVESGEWIVESK